MQKNINSKEFFEGIGQRESSGNYKARNKSGYLGKYQMGESALVDAGYYRKKVSSWKDYNNDWSGTFIGKDGVYSVQDFLNNPQAQENAVRAFSKAQWSYIKTEALKAEGKKINGIVMTQSGMLAGAHLVGHVELKAYLRSNGTYIPSDKNSVSIEEYIKKFSNYNVIDITNTLPISSSQRDLSKAIPLTNYIRTNRKVTGYAANISDDLKYTPDHIFTREEIAQMSNDEYLQNEPAIMQQLKEGKIRSGASAPNYESYTNPITNKKLIYTREDIDSMSDDEYIKHEKAIYKQMNTIGIPYKSDLSSNILTFSKSKSYNYYDEDGHWVTINGNHVFIED